MTQKEALATLQEFPDREKHLRHITRYSLYPVMWYRTNLWIHSRRVAWIVGEIALSAQQVFGNTFDPLKAIFAALVHDDAEIITGDIQLGNKSNMNPQQLNVLQLQEREAVQQLVKQFPSHVSGYEYKALLLDAIDKNSLEAIVVAWADKYDGFCEALHELYAGHALWATEIVNEYGTAPLPTDLYSRYFQEFTHQFPKSVALFECNNSWLRIPPWPNAQQVIQNRKPHSVTSLLHQTGYVPYDQWIALTFTNGTQEDITGLYTKKE